MAWVRIESTTPEMDRAWNVIIGRVRSLVIQFDAHCRARDGRFVLVRESELNRAGCIETTWQFTRPRSDCPITSDPFPSGWSGICEIEVLGVRVIPIPDFASFPVVTS